MKGIGAMKVVIATIVLAVLMAGSVLLVSCAQPSQSSSASASASSASASTEVSVPNTVSLRRSDAEVAIVAAGLKLGKTSAEASDTVPAGCVISQSPAALSKAKVGDKVDLVISKGKGSPKEVVVPDLKGMTQAEAEKALSDVGLIGVASNPEETDAVNPGLVFKQSVAAGSKAKESDRVAFTVALSVSEVEVPDLVGKSQQDAASVLKNANLGFDVTTAYNDKVAQGNVISQSVAAGNKVKAGTTVTLQVSLGQKPVDNVTVPNVLTYSWSDAEYALTSAGLQARFTGDPTGVVTAQDIVGGAKVAPGTLVTVKLTAEVEKIEVPDLVDESVTTAEEITDKLGLSLDLEDGSSIHGVISEQRPEAGTKVSRGATVTVTVDDSEFTG